MDQQIFREETRRYAAVVFLPVCSVHAPAGRARGRRLGRQQRATTGTASSAGGSDVPEPFCLHRSAGDDAAAVPGAPVPGAQHTRLDLVPRVLRSKSQVRLISSKHIYCMYILRVKQHGLKLRKLDALVSICCCFFTTIKNRSDLFTQSPPVPVLSQHFLFITGVPCFVYVLVLGIVFCGLLLSLRNKSTSSALIWSPRHRRRHHRQAMYIPATLKLR